MSRMSFDDAMQMAECMDLPDGAFWAMSHELAGLDYGDGFPVIAPKRRKAPNSRRRAKSFMMQAPKPEGLPYRCGTCGKDFATKGARRNHRNDKHARKEA